MLRVVHNQERFRATNVVVSAFVRQRAAGVVGQHVDVMLRLKVVGVLPVESGFCSSRWNGERDDFIDGAIKVAAKQQRSNK